MEKIKTKKTFFQRMAEILFIVYLSTIYFFNTQADNVYISHIVFVLFAGCSGVYFLQRKRMHIGKNVMTAYLAVAWMFASYFWAYSQYYAWINIKTMWMIFIMFFIVYNLFCEREDAHEFFLKSLYIAGIALIGYSLYTYDLSEVIDMMSHGSNVRIGRDIIQTNVFGIQHATTAIVAFYYFLYKKKHKIFHIIVLAMTFIFAMSSGSRTALLMTCLGILYLIYKKYGIRQVYKIVFVVLIAVLVFMIVIQLPMFATIRTRMKGATDAFSGTGGDDSTVVRMKMITDGWSFFKERVLTGYGATNYTALSRYRTYAHNNFIEVLVDFGIIGFILYYLIYWNAFKNLMKEKADGAKALFAIFCVRFMMEIATITYYEKLNWIILAFCLIGRRKDSCIQENRGEKS